MIAFETHNAADLLAETETKDLLRFVTCGSVDDGKSTLIGRLLYESKGIYEDQLAAVEQASKTVGTTGGGLDLALVTDGLKAEREQGITIDVAYRYFSTPRRKFIIADSPGHEQYTRNMVTGASTADLAILLVDASAGVQVQTRRHAFLASLLGIKHVVVAVNKMDLVGYDAAVFEAIRREFTDFSARLSIPDVEFIPMSALAGEGVTDRPAKMPWYKGRPLLDHLETVHIASDRNLVDARLPVQYVNRPDRTFRGYCGTLASGVLRSGDEVVALPSGVRSTVDKVFAPGGEEVTEAYPPMSVTVTLADEIDVSRGDLLAPVHNVPEVGNRFEAMLTWMHADAMQPGKAYVLKHTTRKVPAEVTDLRYRVDVNTLRQHDAEELGLNEIGRVEIETARPLAFDAYTKNRATGAFILIDRQTHTTVGAGMILDRKTDDAARGRTLAERRRRPRGEGAGGNAVGGVSADERAGRLGHRPFVVWLTGLKGSGKTTIAFALERALWDAGLTGRVLDGGTFREGLSADLSHTGADRGENARRAAEAGRLIAEAGLFTVCAFISPFAADRAAARRTLAEVVGEDGFVEVYLSTPADVCRARLGDDEPEPSPYEPPASAELELRTDEVAAEACVTRVMEVLRARGLLPEATA